MTARGSTDRLGRTDRRSFLARVGVGSATLLGATGGASAAPNHADGDSTPTAESFFAAESERAAARLWIDLPKRERRRVAVTVESARESEERLIRTPPVRIALVAS